MRNITWFTRVRFTRIRRHDDHRDAESQAAGVVSGARSASPDSTPVTSLPNAKAAPATSCPCLYVTNRGVQLNGSPDSVTVYAAGANGNVAPVRTISGSATNLDDPEGIALDSDLNTYVVNAHNNSVTVFAAGANGDATPIQTISGSETGLNDPGGIALDSQRNIYVANYGQAHARARERN